MHIVSMRQRKGLHTGSDGAGKHSVTACLKQAICLFLTAVAAVSCGTEGNRFKMEGRFLNLNQGEFYVYSPDGIMEGMDTVKVNGGRFTHGITCRRGGTLVFLFQNFSEQVVFAEPGKSVSIEADATHLKEMTVNGTPANKLMTRFRKETSGMSPPDVVTTAEKYIRDNPKSPVSVWLLRRYIVYAAEPDYAKALELARVIEDATSSAEAGDDSQKEGGGGSNGEIIRLEREIELLKASAIGTTIPPFDAVDIKGRKVSNADIAGRTAIIHTVAAWNNGSINEARQLKKIVRDHRGKLAVISISLDASKKQCVNTFSRDSLTWPVICDGDMFQSATLRSFGLTRVPDYVVVSPEGKIAAAGMPFKELKTWIAANVK